MTKAFPLTATQKGIITENKDKFPADIAKLPGMTGTTVRQISEYLRRTQNPCNQQASKLADCIQAFIDKNGLPAEYAKVFAYLRYLRSLGD